MRYKEKYTFPSIFLKRNVGKGLEKDIKAYINGVITKSGRKYSINILMPGENIEAMGSSIKSLAEARGRLEGFFHAIGRDCEDTCRSGWSERYCVEPYPRPTEFEVENNS